MKRFWEKVDRSAGLFGCWLWTAGSSLGYGHFRLNGKTRKAHRVAYELMGGPVPEGLELDHLCRNQLCVNPAHLEAVTHKQNVLRGLAPAAQNVGRTRCRRGHPFDTQNTYYSKKGGRRCRVCAATSQRAHWARRKKLL